MLVSFNNTNYHLWRLRHEIQGIKPPSQRTHKQFDPEFYVANDIDYVRYFTATLYQFQFYKALCLKTGQYVPGDPAKPLHRCNFYGSKKAGDKLRETLKMGASRPWQKAMKKITGQMKMKTKTLR